MEEGDLVLCTVEKVSSTVTQVRLPDGKEGTIISSEIAPGRIKHMRQYVVPNKKIVCKILGTEGGHIHLSLRRVNARERKEVLEKWKAEQAAKVAFRQILRDKSEKTTEKILKDFPDLSSFLNAARNDKKLTEKYIPKAEQEAIKKLTQKKKKKQELKQVIKIKCLEKDGVKKIKEIFSIKDKNVSVTYLSAGNFRLNLVVDDFKQGKKRMSEILKELESNAKKNHCEFYLN